METMQDATRRTADSKTPHYNISCQTCRVSKTFVTLQGVNSFVTEHDGHNVIEGRLFERPLVAKKPDAVAEEAKPEAGAPPEVVVPQVEDIVQEAKPQVEDIVQEAKPQVEDIVQEAKPQVEEGDVAVKEEAPAPLPQVVQPAEVQPKEPVEEASTLPTEKDLKEPLLLARSSYIEESDEKRRDALKVSRALKEFRWNVEPPYVIGVMIDDNLSVETNIGVISSSMVEKVEKLGYKFVAINAPQGSPVAWFKKDARGALEASLSVGGADRMMQTRKGTRTYDEDKAVWEESFVSLLMTVKDMDGQKLKRVTDIIKSEQPEPDIQS